MHARTVRAHAAQESTRRRTRCYQIIASRSCKRFKLPNKLHAALQGAERVHPADLRGGDGGRIRHRGIAMAMMMAIPTPPGTGITPLNSKLGLPSLSMQTRTAIKRVHARKGRAGGSYAFCFFVLQKFSETPQSKLCPYKLMIPIIISVWGRVCLNSTQQLPL